MYHVRDYLYYIRHILEQLPTYRAMQVHALAILGLVSGENILGSFIFSRHGDRLTKPTPYLTPIGAQQCFESGEFYHDRYFNEYPIAGLDQVYNPYQFSVMVPISDVLFKSMLAWTQGFYPEVSSDQIDDVEGASLANGTDSDTPDGYQYVLLDGIDEDSGQYWVIKGDDNCPTFNDAQSDFEKSDFMKQMNDSTYSFYQSLTQYTTEIPKKKLNFDNAFTVFDYFLVEGVHNESFSESIGGLDGEVFQQVKILQDIYNVNYNTWNNNLVSGQTLLGEAKTFLANAHNTSYPQRVQVMAGSFDQFYQVFKLIDWYSSDESRFTGIVNYATTFVMELFTQDGSDDQFVRVGIRNGTTVSEGNITLDFLPVFNNTENYMSYDDFQNKLSSVVIADVGEWCNACSSTVDACQAIKLQDLESSGKIKTSSLSLADAGGIGAGVTIGVFLIVGLLGFFTLRMLRKPKATNDIPDMESHASTAVSLHSK